MMLPAFDTNLVNHGATPLHLLNLLIHILAAQIEQLAFRSKYH